MSPSTYWRTARTWLRWITMRSRSMPGLWNSSGGSPGWGTDVSTANEQPGSGLPEEPVESVEPGEPGESMETAEDVGAAAAGSGAGLEAVTGAETGSGSGSENDSGSETASETASETEEERIARERAEFDKLVAAFHSESAPDPQLRHPDPEPGPPAPPQLPRPPALAPPRPRDTQTLAPTAATTADPP